MELEYFPKSVWVGKRIHFPDAGSSWTIREKLTEHSYRLSKKDADEYETTPSAGATFKCQNLENPVQEALMKIHIQVPYSGTEFRPSSVRGTQASANIPEDLEEYIEALRRLRDCKFTPNLLEHKVDVQEEDGLVPRGWIVFLLATAVPGIPLAIEGSRYEYENQLTFLVPDGEFWKNLDRPTRDEIRTHFEAAYKDITAKGVLCGLATLRDIYWDSSTNTLTINTQFKPFGDKYVTKSPTPWSTQYFGVYGLALRPQSLRFPYDPTMTVPQLEKIGWRF
ncbi:hypothetical protein CNMCM8927_008969 [Aspergillus lentulus]|uniref:Uncharacterized protein n=1 Tax=Aspergillus lentulus TaxID=293939 RepID=A0AAN5YLR0_ASPLE|nr:hypothetical protein CNMCM6069_008824 [Aspergillus lentulus]KAF4177917.1 hypothetical protein CNMCM8060_005017 [Aspergillus lentulus]KAF4187354.1 hypothetical protein CNMCM7927_004298 [Aspergillus lentulus]KAF4198927.1 hypothetical protein CNMCM8694_007533 [Aspergillus lentulus]KAF4203291.1 hypothetical protein CNMCM8927_008969 [Aspergillus lentulus]